MVKAGDYRIRVTEANNKDNVVFDSGSITLDGGSALYSGVATASELAAGGGPSLIVLVTYGWDWVDTLPNIGIWRSAHLEGRTWTTLHDFRVDTIIADGTVYLDEAAADNIRAHLAQA